MLFLIPVLVKMSKTPKGLPSAEWTMPSVCVRSDLVCINCYLGGRSLSLSAPLSNAVLVATVTPEGISCMIDWLMMIDRHTQLTLQLQTPLKVIFMLLNYSTGMVYFHVRELA